MNDAPNHAAATRFFARKTLSAVNGKLVSEIPQGPVHVGKVVQGRATGAYGLVDYVLAMLNLTPPLPQDTTRIGHVFEA